MTSNLDRDFLYVARQCQPAEAARIKALDIPGVYLSREYRRYYPAGEVTGQLIGFTNVDDSGQAGLELAYDQWLTGIDGREARDPGSLRPDRAGHREHPRRASRDGISSCRSTCASSTSPIAR